MYQKVSFIGISLFLSLLMSGCESKQHPLEVEANLGNAKTQYKLAQCFLDGKSGLPINKKKAKVWMIKAAENGHTEAQYILLHEGYYGAADTIFNIMANSREANLFGEDESTARSEYENGPKWGVNAAQKGHIKAQLLQGYWQATDDKASKEEQEQGVMWLENSCLKGLIESCEELSRLYEGNVKHFKKDTEKVKKWQLEADKITLQRAKQGSKDDLCDIASHWFPSKFEKDLKLDANTALTLYKNAAKLGEPSALDNLAERYYEGKELPKNYQKAYSLYTELEKIDSQLKKVYCRDDSSGSEMRISNRAKREYVLGEMYFYGRGVSLSDAEALKWYLKAVSKPETNSMYPLGNVEDAFFKIGVIYETGSKDDLRDPQEAFKWYLKSATHNDNRAMKRLGFLYVRGEGIPQNFVEAHKWFNISASMGDEEAQKRRDGLLKYMSKEQIAEAQKLAESWKPTYD